ncbi:MAG: type II secretion system F family protein [Verrucomicrobia bacterium]|nr:type II secretion system F family protein [Verrucomicrobiota bacterium]MCG2678986.1 type II secretion system F family protein [Kiritimatiellia bacterium]MBU4248338.1 type II secretion system F family protein [Verrucomicrobiota bacterium]MBU4289723.1 type II secretion system F family protein [Verrucomicrobiota bacterium]MBU4428563.1 type II secretion system F family protein [Verrucomicrobiota bacterium]
MPSFKYVASDGQGKERAGQLDAVNRISALAKLKEMGLFPSSVEEVTSKAVSVKRASAGQPAAAPKAGGGKREFNISLPGFLGGGVKKKQLMVFTRQLATLIDAGVPLLRALQILNKQERSTALKRIDGELCEAVEGGSTFAEALSQHPKVFDKLFVNMVRAGEVGGVLEVTLNKLAEFIEKAEKIKTTVRGAMVYPIVVLITAVGILTFLMIKIIPSFTEIFESLLKGTPLPALTQFVVHVSNMFVHRTPMVVIALVVLIIFIKLIGKSRPGRHYIDLLKLKIPIIGGLVSKVSISRFSRTLGTLMTSGVQILQALTIVRDTAGNEVVARAVQSVHDSVKEGETVAAPMEASGVFPAMVVSMVTVGEETGRLPEMLVKIADNYDTEVDAAVEGMTSIIEPIMIIFLAVVVGTIVIAMFMPLISIVQNLQ